MNEPTRPAEDDSTTAATTARADILDGPLLPAVVRLAAPVTLMMALHTAFQVVDLAWVGRLGAAATAAVATCFYASWILSAVSEAIGIGIVAQVSRAIGAGRSEQAGHIAAQGTLVAAIVGLLLVACSPFAGRLLFELLGMPDDVSALGAAYFRILLLGGVPLMLAISLESIWRAAGDTVTPMWVMGGATVLNLILDPPLIFGWGPIPALGVAGAAWASVASWVAAVIAFALLARHHHPRIPFRFSSLARVDRFAFRTTVRIGSPRLLLGVLYSSVYLFLSALTARLGTAAVAVLGIGNRLESVTYLISAGIGVGVATMVGQNLGARQPARAARATWVAMALAIAAAIVPTVAMLAVPAPILRFFSADAQVVDLGMDYLWILALCQVFMALELVAAEAFAGAGDTLPPTIVELPISLLRIPLAWWIGLELGYGLLGIAWVLTLTCIARGVWMALWFRTGRWQRRTWEGQA